MSYIGASPTQVAFVTDTFSGNGSTTAFTMSVAPANAASVLVAISGVLQDPTTYSVAGTTLTFSAAPPAGTGNISSRYLGIPASGVTTTAYRTITEFTATAGQTTFTPASYTVGFIQVYRNGVLLGSADYTASNGTTVVLAVGATSGDLVTTISFYVSSVLNAIPATGGSVGVTYLDVGSGTGTGAMTPPAGTTAQRPSSPATGAQRWNTTLGQMEAWTGSQWQQITSLLYSISYLVVAGGGSGGGGGGGAGGLLSGTGALTSGTAYSIVVGAGASGTSGGATGSNSTFNSLTAFGGGGGGYNVNGLSGGSGGGAGYNGGSLSGGAGTSGQGFAGGTVTSGSSGGSGGGGGASAVGNSVSSNANGAAGGAGVSSSISGSAVTYAGGGGGGTNAGTGGAGGAGGGGTGGNAGNATSGTANTGGGGGGIYTAYPAGNGGSGIVIISYLGSQRGTGGTVTSSGGYTIHTFTSSGTYNA